MVNTFLFFLENQHKEESKMPKHGESQLMHDAVGVLAGTKTADRAGRAPLHRAIFLAKLALRHLKDCEDPIYREMFWDALNGADRYDRDEFIDEDKARKYFLAAYPDRSFCRSGLGAIDDSSKSLGTIHDLIR
jgi:hypothetical protein